MLSSQYGSYSRSVIAKAMNEYHRRTCIRFVPKDARHRGALFLFAHFFYSLLDLPFPYALAIVHFIQFYSLFRLSFHPSRRRLLLVGGPSRRTLVFVHFFRKQLPNGQTLFCWLPPAEAADECRSRDF